MNAFDNKELEEVVKVLKKRVVKKVVKVEEKEKK